jgi:magnesium transporter
MDQKKKNKFLKKSAGSLMTDNVPVILDYKTIRFVENYLLENTKKLESINYVYAIDKTRKLKGVISIKEIFRQTKDKKISKVMTKNLVTVHPHTNQEKVAHLALNNNIKSIPVVNKDNKFLGVVLGDDILKALHKEFQEDMLKLAGLNNHDLSHIDDISTMSIWTSLKHRLPWLILGLLGGLLAAQVIGLFEETLSENIILASFIPLVVYMSSAVGTQIGFFIIRDLAIRSKINFWLYTLGQLKVIFTLGLVISSAVFAITYFIYAQMIISWALSLAMFFAILSSVTTGLFIPYAFSKLRFDPANASGPIATIIQDLMSVTIYLLIAKSIL